MNGLEGAADGQSLAHLLQSQVGFAGQEFTQFLPVALNQGRPAPGVAMAWPQVASVAALLEELLDHPQGDAEAAGDFLAVAFLLVIGVHDALAQVQGDCFSHVQTMAKPPRNGYSFI
jgi:hypothetical protein